MYKRQAYDLKVDADNRSPAKDPVVDRGLLVVQADAVDHDRDRITFSNGHPHGTKLDRSVIGQNLYRGNVLGGVEHRTMRRAAECKRNPLERFGFRACVDLEPEGLVGLAIGEGNRVRHWVDVADTACSCYVTQCPPS